MFELQPVNVIRIIRTAGQIRSLFFIRVIFHLSLHKLDVARVASPRSVDRMKHGTLAHDI
jgi:hypothetical protein